jgi:hypothetical protein
MPALGCTPAAFAPQMRQTLVFALITVFFHMLLWFGHQPISTTGKVFGEPPPRRRARLPGRRGAWGRLSGPRPPQSRQSRVRPSPPRGWAGLRPALSATRPSAPLKRDCPTPPAPKGFVPVVLIVGALLVKPVTSLVNYYYTLKHFNTRVGGGGGGEGRGPGVGAGGADEALAPEAAAAAAAASERWAAACCFSAGPTPRAPASPPATPTPPPLRVAPCSSPRPPPPPQHVFTFTAEEIVSLISFITAVWLSVYMGWWVPHPTVRTPHPPPSAASPAPTRATPPPLLSGLARRQHVRRQNRFLSHRAADARARQMQTPPAPPL